MDATPTRHVKITPKHFPLESSADTGRSDFGTAAQSTALSSAPTAFQTENAKRGRLLAGIGSTDASAVSLPHTCSIPEHKAWRIARGDTGPAAPEDRAVPLTTGDDASYLISNDVQKLEPSYIEDLFEEARTKKPTGFAATMTRGFDITVAIVAIIAFLPLLVVVACAIRASGPGPVIFVQRRVGHSGGLFPCLKFRSMVINSQEVLDRLLAECPRSRAEWARDQKLRSDPRITPIGALLRKSSLDELPQLFNVLFGHMSIVGPRPIVEAEIERYGHRFDAYCSVRPGLTGLWQVSGRNEVSYEARVRLDARYAQRKSLSYDMAICLRTVPAVLGSRGCY